MLFSKEYKDREFMNYDMHMSRAMQAYIFHLMKLDEHCQKEKSNTEHGLFLQTLVQAAKQELYVEQINQVNFAGKTRGNKI